MPNKCHPFPNNCCLKCRYGKLVRQEQVRCLNENSEYYKTSNYKKHCCDAFIKDPIMR